MNPILLNIGNLSIRWYGVCTAAGLLLGYFLQLKRRKLYSFSQEMVADLTFFCMLAGIIGARIAYIMRFWNDEFAGRGFLALIAIWEGGLVFQGGFVAACLTGVALAKFRGWSLGVTSDLIAPALPAAHALGRIGCLINGCCFGFMYEGPLAVYYPAEGNAVLYTQKFLGLIPVEAKQCAGTFPVAGLEALGNILLCLLLLFLEKKGKLKNRLFLLYIMIYTSMRFILEFFRGDYLYRKAGLSNAQITCLWIIPLCAIVWIFLRLRRIMSYEC